MGFFPVNPPASGGGGGGATIIGTPGPPASGAHTAGYTVLDSNGATWMCTASGTPGTFVTISGKPKPDWPPPSGALGFDYEFNATTTSIPSGWSWFNQGTTTYSEGSGLGVFNLTATGADNLRGITQPLPTAPFTATAKIQVNSVDSASAYFKAGVTLTNGTGYINMTTGGNAGAGAVAIEHYTNATTYDTYLYNWNVTQFMVLYFQIIYTSSSNVTFLVSPDGVSWNSLRSNYNVSGSYFTPTAIGLVGTTTNSTENISYSCQFFRVR